MNFLEQLAAEWYSYLGYFVRTNVKHDKRGEGGWEGEIDVVAYKPKDKIFIHLEGSSDADSWQERRERIIKKYQIKTAKYQELFGIPMVDLTIKRIAVYGWNSVDLSTKRFLLEKNIYLISNSEFVNEIVENLKTKSPFAEAVSEAFPILRGMQYASYFHYRQKH